MKNTFKFFAVSFAAVLVLADVSFAAPTPGAGSSKLVSPKLGLFRSPLGFQISAGGSGWKLSEPPADNKFIATMYRAPEDAQPSVGEQIHADLHKDTRKTASAANAQADDGESIGKSIGALTVRVDELKKATTLDKYITRWKKEYPRYGFDVLGAKAFSQNTQKGFVLDLLNRDTKRQMRQVIFMKGKKAAILTCRDESDAFKDTLKACNQIIRTFEWTN